jgi:hypothetical protein
LWGYEIINRDGNVLRLIGQTPYVENEVIGYRLEVSGETIIVTIIDAEDEGVIGSELTLNSVDEIPFSYDKSSYETSSEDVC